MTPVRLQDQTNAAAGTPASLPHLGLNAKLR